MTQNNIITKKLKNKIDDICEQGDLLIIDFYDYPQAIQKYNEALQLVPEPKEEFDTTTWIYTAIADAYYLNDDFTKAMEYFTLAYKLPKGENAFVNLRIGQCYNKENNLELTQKHLLLAYKLGGAEIFDEYEDTFNLIKESLKTDINESEE